LALLPQIYPFADTILAIQTRLSEKLELDKSKITIASNDDYSIPNIDDRFIAVRPYGPQPAANAGAGGKATPVSRRIRFYLYSRLNVDVAGDDSIALTSTDFGHFRFEDSVYQWLASNYFPSDTVDGVRRRLTIEPLSSAR
jgi:hypothetical protein